MKLEKMLGRILLLAVLVVGPALTAGCEAVPAAADAIEAPEVAETADATYEDTDGDGVEDAQDTDDDADGVDDAEDDDADGDGIEDEQEIEGVIEAIDGTLVTINGQSFEVPEDVAALLSIGDLVSIETEAEDDQTVVHIHVTFTGTVESISGSTVTINGQTYELPEDVVAALTVGGSVELTLVFDQDGALVSAEVNVEDDQGEDEDTDEDENVDEGADDDSSSDADATSDAGETDTDD